MSATAGAAFVAAQFIPGLDVAVDAVALGIAGAAAVSVIGAEIYQHAGHQAVQANTKADEQLKDSDASEPCVECDEDPCAHLRKGNGGGKYRGGAHGETKGPSKDGLDSHHTPAAQASKEGGGPARDDGPAIQMEPKDHRDTASYGGGAGPEAYREKQAELIKEGKLLDATKMDIEDVKKIAAASGDPAKYDEALKEMQAYAECLQNQIDKGKP
ncbi:MULTISPECIES: hypothetical protein [unclassified Acidocella]|uniref:hypothetical protein n=1 Tax=unclassified Acidocella TaxID=2648610 RepID=UPI00028EADC5|nr:MULTISPECIES: hypothetical protein [unclassified Acidocella]EKM99870.1 hypothetical protein MXAZACID_08239 [Acidocella sp. MX-AZ02]WBO59460.1 hypothetical protein GT370_00460 [Acidocella sp. MX-AZ03]